MSEYKGIKGFQVQTRTEDPTPYAQALADNPYAGAWGSGGSLNTGRQNLAGAGTLTAGIVFGGQAPSATGVTEKYDGSSWTESGDLNNARRYLAGSGASSSSALAFGGLPPTTAGYTEQFDGTSWTNKNAMNRSSSPVANSDYIGGAGTVTNTIAFGAGEGSDKTGRTETFDGTNWTEVADLNTARGYIAGVGDSTSALAISGYTGTASNVVEQWNGSAWTEIAEVNTARFNAGSSGATPSAVFFGGSAPSNSSATEQWDGSSWTEVNDLTTARAGVGSSETTAISAFIAGGTNPTNSSATEEWTFSGLPPSTPAADYADAIIGDFYYNSTTGQFKNVSSGVGSWSSGGNLNGGRYGIMGAGTLTAGLAMGGTFQPSDTTKNTAETYDGTSWTNAPTLPGNIRDGGSWGVQTSAVQVGGSTSPGATPFGSTAYEFDGSSFSNGGSLNTARRYNAGAGAASTAGITFGGGNPGPYVAITESYDGSTFTEVADLNTARNYLGAAGTQTAAIAAGGSTGSDVANVELWDGSSWTETTDINTARGFASPSAGMGSQTSAIVVSGNPNNVESWDGTSWTEIADLGTSRSSGHTVGFNSTSAGMYFGGSPNSYATYTEEWDQPSFQIKTVTTS